MVRIVKWFFCCEMFSFVLPSGHHFRSSGRLTLALAEWCDHVASAALSYDQIPINQLNDLPCLTTTGHTGVSLVMKEHWSILMLHNLHMYPKYWWAKPQAETRLTDFIGGSGRAPRKGCTDMHRNLSLTHLTEQPWWGLVRCLSSLKYGMTDHELLSIWRLSASIRSIIEETLTKVFLQVGDGCEDVGHLRVERKKHIRMQYIQLFIEKSVFDWYKYGDTWGYRYDIPKTIERWLSTRIRMG